MTIEIVPIERRHIAAFHQVLDAVAREGRYLAFVEAPPLARVRRFVVNGFSNGTVHYVALRALGLPDAFPHTDLGVMKALSETQPARVLARAQAWRPWRGYAAFHLWRRLARSSP